MGRGSHGWGADAAFCAAIDLQRDRAIRLAFLLCGDAAEAEDVVAESVARMLRPWRRGTIEDLGAYLRTVVVNEVRRRGRRRGRERELTQRRTADHRGEVAADERIVVRAEVLDALVHLPERQRLAIVLRYFDDCSVATTAQLMGTTEGTVKSQVARALGTLRDHLTPDAISGGER